MTIFYGSINIPNWQKIFKGMKQKYQNNMLTCSKVEMKTQEKRKWNSFALLDLKFE